MTRRCDCDSDACDSRNAAMPNKIITALSQRCRRYCSSAVTAATVTYPLTLSSERAKYAARAREQQQQRSSKRKRRCYCAATVAAGRKQMNERNKTTTTATTRRCCACSVWCKSSAATHKCGRECACVCVVPLSLSLSLSVRACVYAGV